MGFDLFVHRFRNGQSSPYPRQIAEEIFDRGALRPSDLKFVEYPDGRDEIATPTISTGSGDGGLLRGPLKKLFGQERLPESACKNALWRFELKGAIASVAQLRSTCYCRMDEQFPSRRFGHAD